MDIKHEDMERLIMFEDVRILRSALRHTDDFPAIAVTELKPGMLISNGIVAVWMESSAYAAVGAGEYRFLYSIALVSANPIYTTFSRQEPSDVYAATSLDYSFDTTFSVIWGV